MKPGGFLLAVLGVVFLVVTAFLSIREAVDWIDKAGSDPDAAPSVESLGRLSAGEIDEMEARTKAAFARNPLDAKALVTIARVADLRGDQETAARLKLIAGDLKPRVTSVQAEALSILLSRRDFAAAMVQIDGLIRSRPNRRPALLALLTEIAADPEGRNAVATALASDPPWRAALFAKAISEGKSGIAQNLMSEMRALGSPATGTELALLINYHLKAGDTARAYAIWLSSLTEAELNRVKLVYDGGFEGDIRNQAFDWTIELKSGFSYRTFPRNTSSMDQSLQLDFQRFAGAFRNVSQILLLKPGRYRLTGEARFEGFQSPAGLAFRIYCREGRKLTLLSETLSLPQSSQWMAFEKTLSLPETGCTSQLLRLESRGEDNKTGELNGQVALDSLAIDLLPDLVH